MAKKLSTIYVFFIGLSVSSCATPKYYHSDKTASKAAENVGLDIFVEAAPNSANNKTLFDLSERAQAEYIKQYYESAGDDADPTKLAQLFASPIKPKAKIGPSIDKSRVQAKKKVSVTLYTENFKPADRLTEAKINIPAPRGWSFTAWSAPKIETVTSKIATVVDSSSVSTNVPFDFLDSVFSAGPFSSSEQVTQELNRKVVELLPSITQKWANFRLLAPTPQSNVVGNYSAVFSFERDLQYRVYTHSFDIKADKPSLGLTTVYFSNDNDAQDSADKKISFTYTYRQVTGVVSSSTVKERDDRVVFKTATSNNDTKLEPNKNLDLTVFVAGYSGATSFTPLRARVIKTNGRNETVENPASCLFFTSYSDSYLFRQWLTKEKRRGKFIVDNEKNQFELYNFSGQNVDFYPIKLSNYSTPQEIKINLTQSVTLDLSDCGIVKVKG